MAAMEGLFKTESGAGIVLMGQPNEETGQIDNPIVVNNVLSFLIYGTTKAEVNGLDQLSARSVAHCAAAALLRLPHHGRPRNVLRCCSCSWLHFCSGAASSTRARWMLWPLLLSFPLPYIANTAGWMTAEIGRQPWLIYGLMRTSEGFSNTVSAGNGLFTLIGFMGLYALLGLLFTVLVYREISIGPEPANVALSSQIAARRLKVDCA